MLNEEEINVAVTFRHTESTPALKSYAEEKVSNCLRKFRAQPAKAHVVLAIEKRDHSAEIQVHSKIYDATCKATTEDLYSAIDKVVDTLGRQLEKQKERVKNHKGQKPLVEE